MNNQIQSAQLCPWTVFERLLFKFNENPCDETFNTLIEFLVTQSKYPHFWIETFTIHKKYEKMKKEFSKLEDEYENLLNEKN